MSNTSVAEKLWNEYSNLSGKISLEDFLRAKREQNKMTDDEMLGIVLHFKEAEIKKTVENNDKRRKWNTISGGLVLAAGVSIAAVSCNMKGKEITAEHQLRINEVKGVNELALLQEETKRVLIEIAYGNNDPAKLLAVKEKWDVLLNTYHLDIGAESIPGGIDAVVQPSSSQVAQNVVINQSSRFTPEQAALRLEIIRMIIDDLTQEQYKGITQEQILGIYNFADAQADSYGKAEDKEDWFSRNVIQNLPSYKIIAGAVARKEARAEAGSPNWVDKFGNWIENADERNEIRAQEAYEREQTKEEKREWKIENGNWFQRTGAKLYYAAERNYEKHKDYYDAQHANFQRSIMEQWYSTETHINIKVDKNNQAQEQNNSRRNNGAGNVTSNGDTRRPKERESDESLGRNDGVNQESKSSLAPAGSIGRGSVLNNVVDTDDKKSSTVVHGGNGVTRETSFIAPVESPSVKDSWNGLDTKKPDSKLKTLNTQKTKSTVKDSKKIHASQTTATPRDVMLVEFDSIADIGEKMAWLSANQGRMTEIYGAIKNVKTSSKLRHVGSSFDLVDADEKMA